MSNAYNSARYSSVASDLPGIFVTLIVGYLIRRPALARQREE